MHDMTIIKTLKLTHCEFFSFLVRTS